LTAAVPVVDHQHH